MKYITSIINDTMKAFAGHVVVDSMVNKGGDTVTVWVYTETVRGWGRRMFTVRQTDGAILKERAIRPVAYAPKASATNLVWGHQTLAPKG